MEKSVYGSGTLENKKVEEKK